MVAIAVPEENSEADPPGCLWCWLAGMWFRCGQATSRFVLAARGWQKQRGRFRVQELLD